MLGKSIDEIILDISSAIHLWIADEIEKIGAASDFMISMGQAEQEKRDWRQGEV